MGKEGNKRRFCLVLVKPSHYDDDGYVFHPLECGFLRRKVRSDRRPGFPIEPAWRFYPKYLSETAAKLVRWSWLYLRLRRSILASSMIRSVSSTPTSP
jgi:hypothetical protein